MRGGVSPLPRVDGMMMPRSVRRVATVVTALMLLGWFVMLRPAFLLDGPASYIIVQGHSMEPTLYTGDLAVVRAQSDYAVGDVVAFTTPEGTVIHRIVGGNSAEGFVLLGDNNPNPDRWRPREADILGSMAFHVDGLGGVAKSVRESRWFGAIAGLVFALLVLPAGRQVRRPIRRRSAAVNSHVSRSYVDGHGDGPRGATQQNVGLLAGLVAVGTLGVASALAAFFAFQQPLVTREVATELEYEQAGTFDYAVDVLPISIYPGGIVKPVADGGGESARPAQAVFTRLANSMTVDYQYRVGAEAASELVGTVAADLHISADGGWNRTTELLASRPFSGQEVNERVRIDLRELRAFLDQVEAETGFQARSYDAVITFRTSFAGVIRGRETTDDFAATLGLTLDPSQLTPHGPLELRTPVQVSSTSLQTNFVDAGFVRLPVLTARVAAVGIASASAAVAALLASVVFLGVGRSERARIRARYSSILLRVRASGEARRERVRVASINDLVRLARRDGALIFEEEGVDGPRYVVRDGDTDYEYRPREDVAETTATLMDARLSTRDW